MTRNSAYLGAFRCGWHEYPFYDSFMLLLSNCQGNPCIGTLKSLTNDWRNKFFKWRSEDTFLIYIVTWNGLLPPAWYPESVEHSGYAQNSTHCAKKPIAHLTLKSIKPLPRPFYSLLDPYIPFCGVLNRILLPKKPRIMWPLVSEKHLSDYSELVVQSYPRWFS